MALLLAPVGDGTLQQDIDFSPDPEGIEALRSAATISILTHAWLSEEERRHDHTLKPGGWWADEDAEEIWGVPRGRAIGSKLRLLDRSKLSEATPFQAEEIIRESLAWMTDPQIRLATRIIVACRREGDGHLSADVRIIRGPKDEIALRFQSLWSE